MRRLVTLLAIPLALACASSKGGGSSPHQPDLELVQLVGPRELNYPAGDIEVQYGVRIANRATEPITLRHIQLATVASGGAYQLERETYYFNLEIEPEQHHSFSFWARAVATGGRDSTDARAPIAVRGVAYFESRSGGFRKVFVKYLAQGLGTGGW